MDEFVPFWGRQSAIRPGGIAMALQIDGSMHNDEERLQRVGIVLGARKRMSEVFVSNISDMADGDRRIVTSGDQEVGVFRRGDQLYAYSNYCVHAGGPVCEGLVINRVVDLIAPDRTYVGQDFSEEVHFVCPWHGYEFDLKTGECVGDRRLKLKSFPVITRDGAVYVVI